MRFELDQDIIYSTYKTAYADRGGCGFPIVFLHGSGFSKEVFAGQFKSSLLASNRLIAMDLPGHGASKDAKDPKKTYSYSGFADEVEEFIAQLGLKKCVVVGWSLGGQVALEMIDRSPVVAGVMALGAPPAPNGPVGLMRSMHFCRVLLLAGQSVHSPGDATYFEKACLSGYGEGKFVDTILRTDPQMRPNISRSILMGYGQSQRDRFENASIPVCLLHGAEEPLIRTPYMQGLESPNLYGGETIILDGVGHAPFLEAPDLFDSLVKQFADAVESGEMATPILPERSIAMAG